MKFLNGLRVIDFSQFLPGPYATQILADLGADVVKIERLGGEPMRTVGPIDNDGISVFYKSLNAGKRIIELDLKTGEGNKHFSDLIAAADVLVESFRPGVLERLGFGIEQLRADFPELIICSLSGYGQTGPYRLRAGHDLNYLAYSGLLEMSGTVDAPTQPQPPISDYAGAMQAVNSILAALVGRANNGDGAYLDISMAESVLAWQSLSLNAIDSDEYPMDRGNGKESGGSADYRIYPTADNRFITLAAEGDVFWRNFCVAVDHEEWINRINESVPQQALIAEVEALFLSQPLQHWRKLLDAVECCFEVALDAGEIPKHPQVASRQLLSTQNWPDPISQILYPAWINGSPPEARQAPAFLDSHQVISGWQQG